MKKGPGIWLFKKPAIATLAGKKMDDQAVF
jgi:hypothetical protein